MRKMMPRVMRTVIMQNMSFFNQNRTRQILGLRAYLCAFLASLMMLVSVSARAQLEIDIVHGAPEPVPVAIPDFLSSHPDTDEIAKKMAAVIAADLERSGLFRVLDQKTYLETQTDINYEPRFADWRLINAKALLSGKIVRESSNRLTVEFRLWDIYANEQLDGKRLATTPDNWRRIAHKISDYIYKRLTGEGGYFDSRIVYISESGPKTDRRKRLAIMDQDGENHKFLTNGQDLVLTPRFSPSTQEILYMSYKGGRPRVYLRDLQTGREEALGSFKGMSFAPRFNHNGKRMVMSIAHAGNTEIYEMDLRSRKLQRLRRKGRRMRFVVKLIQPI